MYHNISHGNVERIGLNKLRIPFIISNAILYIITFADCIVFLVDYYRNFTRGNHYKIYLSNVLLIAGVSLIASLGFLIYGFLLLKKLKKIVPFVPKNSIALMRIAFLTTIFSLCFLSRFIFFLYNPITKKDLPIGVFETFAYYIPEIIPSITQLCLMFPIAPQQYIIFTQFKSQNKQSDLFQDTSDSKSKSNSN
ncbi:tobamovirus multiplication protein 1-like isoform x1 [Anaeramoeba ignava]|uniref:Tobamovirus multiplication protein 1-like isoform x1 n=1 Tax=Anaeramoeba ignava TaxID=1746090 RepID=A0A9Q0R8Y8_ANAIG|nr:tobamovirus multiplication protein 1-like isoform x1 [Anaeramoeba ignava]